MVTELEYINILPDMSKFQSADESSFLKGINNISEAIGTPTAKLNVVGGISSQVDIEKSERIHELEQQLEQHRKQIEDLEEERRSSGMNTDRVTVSSDNASSTNRGENEKEKDKDVATTDHAQQELVKSHKE